MIKGDDGMAQHPVYDTQEKEWRHLNFFEHECYLQARVPRVKLPDGSIRLIEPPWSGLQNGFTLLFEALVLQLAKHMPVHSAAQLVHVSDHKIWSILDKYIEGARRNCDYKKVTQLGVDETSIAKGHNYVSLFVDLEKKKTMFVADGKDSSTVAAFKNDFEAHSGVSNKITDVSCDMSPAFIKGVHDNLPEAKITFDKFHITFLAFTSITKDVFIIPTISVAILSARFTRKDKNIRDFS
jgi:transposase